MITDIFDCLDTVKVRNDVILNNGYDVMNCLAKSEKFLAHSIIMSSFMTVGGQLPELDRGGLCCPPPPYKLGSQNTPYTLGLDIIKIK